MLPDPCNLILLTIYFMSYNLILAKTVVQLGLGWTLKWASTKFCYIGFTLLANAQSSLCSSHTLSPISALSLKSFQAEQDLGLNCQTPLRLKFWVKEVEVFFWDLIFEPKNIIWTKNFFWTKICFGPNIFSEQKFVSDQILFSD